MTLQEMLDKARSYQDSGHQEVAEHLYRAVLALDDRNPEANYNLGILHLASGRADQALKRLRIAVDLSPQTVPYWLFLVRTLIDLDKPREALNTLDQAAAYSLDTPELGELKCALSRQFPELDPTSSRESSIPAFSIPSSTSGTRDCPTALVTEERPDQSSSIMQTRLLDLIQKGQLLQARILARKLTDQYADDGFGWKVLGTLLVQEGHHQAALPILERAKGLLPRDAEVLNSLARAYQGQGQFEKALDIYRDALVLQPGSAEVWNNQGLVQQHLGFMDEALRSYAQAIERQPNYAKAHANLGLLLQQLDRPEEALAVHETVLRMKPDDLDTLNLKGLALQDLGHLDAAADCFESILAIQPTNTLALTNRGNLFKDQGFVTEALNYYRQALDAKPTMLQARQNLLFCLNYLSDISCKQLFAEHGEFEQYHTSELKPLPVVAPVVTDAERQLRIGFVSGDFRQHSVASFLLPVLEHLDRQGFLIFCYITSLRRDAITEMFRDVADGWIEASGLTATALANRIRSDQIDLLFDLSGHSEGNALLTFALKPAPLQISWLGYPNTTGLKGIDYRLVDATTDPVGEADDFHSECLIRLPRGFLCYRPWSTAADLNVSPPPCLDRGQVTFGSFNNIAKLTPFTLDLWCGLLRSLPESRLLLKSHSVRDAHFWAGMLEHFAERGIEAQRIQVLPRAFSYSEHLDQYRGMDIALDTFPYHGTTTTCEALFMGVPVITLLGDRHASRVGASLLNHVDLSELIATSVDDYVRIASNLANDRERLIQMRMSIRERLESSPLRDEVGFARGFETALRQMWRICCSGQSPRVFEIEPSDDIQPSDVQSVPSQRVEIPEKTKKKPKSALKNKRGGLSALRRLHQRILRDSKIADGPTAADGEAILGFFKEGRYGEAETVARRLIERYPEAMFGWKALGTILVKVERNQEAIPYLLEAVRISPGEDETIHNLGYALLNLSRFEEAIACFKRALEINPDYVEANINLGTAYKDTNRLDDAMHYYDQALELAPENPEVYCNRGVALDELGRLSEAKESHERALELLPVYPQAYNNLGNVCKSLGLLSEAVTAYRKALEQQPELKATHSNLLLCLNYDHSISPAQIFVEHQAFDQRLASRVLQQPPLSGRNSDPERTLRLGIVSGDLRLHSVTFFLLPVLERLNQDQFQLFCYSRSHRQDDVTRALRNVSYRWVDCPGLSEQELADRIRLDEIDLLMDLSGHTSPNALLAFAARPAPVQISWLGYPNTTGLEAMDYRIVDEITDPAGEADQYHSEKLIRLPRGFLCYRPWKTDADLNIGRPPCRARNYITFGSFNNLAKVTQATLDLWAGVMMAVPEAHLILKTHTASEIDVWNRLVAYLQDSGVNPGRIETLPRAPSYANHLLQYQGFDIALDTYPYHGTTTTCEALFMGVPVVTLMGNRHASRVGGSLLTHMGLAELVADSSEDYVRIATELANDVDRLSRLRNGLRERLESSPLRDEVGFTRSFEQALRQMWRIWCAGESPRVFDVGQDSLSDAQGNACPTSARVTGPPEVMRKSKRSKKKGSRIANRGDSRINPKRLTPTPAEEDAVVRLFNEGRYAEAEIAAHRLCHSYPQAPFGWKILGTILVKLNRHEDALPHLLAANRLAPDDAQCINALGSALQHLGRLGEALDCFRRVLEIDPSFVLAHANMGAVLSDSGRYEEALSSYQQALWIKPDSAEAYINRGLTLHRMGRLDDSLECYQRLLEIRPDDAALNKRGILLQNLGRPTEALASFDAALTLRPDSADALTNRGNVFKDLGDMETAESSYLEALRIQPDLREAWHNRLLCLNYRDAVSRQEVYAAHLAFGRQQNAQVFPLPAATSVDRDPDRCLRLGWVSGDFRRHSVAFFLLPVLERLNRHGFQSFCYMTSPRQDEATAIFRELADVWVDGAALGTRALANRIRADRIDILIDLSGHTESNVLPTFVARPAPLQVNWIGYPNTTGLTAMDYRLVDEVTDPLGDADPYHSEHLIRLPLGFLCYRPWQSISSIDVGPLPGHESGVTTFGSFNNLAKVSPTTLRLWAEVLRSVPGSRLMLKTPTSFEPHVWARVVECLEGLGIDPERLESMPRLSNHKDHLSLYQRIDIAIDTYPYHGTTTTCEALFMGVPVVTLMGDRHASRVGPSLLTRVGLSELIARSEAEYVRIAADLAADTERLGALRAGLRQRVEQSPLRDEILFTRTLEVAFRQMWRIFCRGEQPRVFEISATES